MYEYHNNLLSIPARLLYDDWELMAYNTYQSYVRRGKLVRTKEGRGKDNEAFVSFYDLPLDIKQVCKRELGDPTEVVVRNHLEGFITPDVRAARFFSEHRKPDGRPLSEELQREKATNSMILNAVKTILENSSITIKVFGKQKTQIWANISEAVNTLNTSKWMFSLPGNPRRLKAKYEDYLKEGYMTFIHKGEGKANAAKIKGDIADYLLAMYCLPNKIKIPELLKRYEEMQMIKGWESLTEQAIYNWLNEPEQARVWTLARDGKEKYKQKYGHTLSLDKSNWFPNVYWTIDGTKLDWIHLDENSSNKMGAKLKIDVVFDVFSEKIIGWSLGFSENHVEHFRAIKMAVNEAQCRPYYMTYDNQSGHKTTRMQDLYTSLMAEEGGFHHLADVGTKGPAEGLFGRLQQEVINRFWFSDGQSIKVRRADNQMNPDFIKANTSSLKTIDELQVAWKTAVTMWNNGACSRSKKHTRSEMYAMEMTRRESLSVVDIIDKMWITEAKRPIEYKSFGLQMQVGSERYNFEVYDAIGNVDLDFRRKNIGKKFIVRYDPDFLDGYIQLFEKDHNGDAVFVSNAEPKRMHQAVPILQEEGSKALFKQDYAIRKMEMDRDMRELEALQARTGITPDLLIEEQDLIIKFGGDVKKARRELAEASEKVSLLTQL